MRRRPSATERPDWRAKIAAEVAAHVPGAPSPERERIAAESNAREHARLTAARAPQLTKGRAVQAARRAANEAALQTVGPSLQLPTPHDAQSSLASFDWLTPSYDAEWSRRIRLLARLEADPGALALAKRFYREDREGHVRFIEDWGVTVDPRNDGVLRPVIMPFILFPRQREFLMTLRESIDRQRDLVLVKSRDCGASWLAMAFSVWLCLFHANKTVGFGSATEEKVDKSGEPDCLFYKGRKFVEYLPRQFKGGWTPTSARYSQHRTLIFPDTECTINGQIGDGIGRGGRKSIYFVDEFAFIERPKIVDANLIANTNCRIEMSSVQGTANVFAERARGGKVRRFDFHYRDDPRKVNSGAPVEVVAYEDDGSPQLVTVETGGLWPWFARKKADSDPTVWNQEYECDFLASVEGIIIPQEWVQAAIGAHVKLKITPTGAKRGAFDVADRGFDRNCYASKHGVLLRHIESWSGKTTGDIYASTEKSFRTADQFGDEGFVYDGDGMGAGVRGDARKILDLRRDQRQRKMYVGMFRGSGAVLRPEQICEGTDRKNKDFFENFKAQSWWNLRRRFNTTWRAVTGALAQGKYRPDDIISIDPLLPELARTTSELSQPVWLWSKTGKMMIDKQPDDVASPNNADAVMMLYSDAALPMTFSDAIFDVL